MHIPQVSKLQAIARHFYFFVPTFVLAPYVISYIQYVFRITLLPYIFQHFCLRQSGIYFCRKTVPISHQYFLFLLICHRIHNVHILMTILFLHIYKYIDLSPPIIGGCRARCRDVWLPFFGGLRCRATPPQRFQLKFTRCISHNIGLCPPVAGIRQAAQFCLKEWSLEQGITPYKTSFHNMVEGAVPQKDNIKL